MIKIEISGESMGDIELALQALNRPDLRTMPLDDLRAVALDRFAEAGFILSVLEAKELPHPPLLTPAEVEALAEKIEERLAETASEDTVLPTRRKKTTVAKKPAPVPEPDVKADAVVVTADRAYVLDELTKRFADPKQKTQAKSFIDKIAGRHGGVRLSRLEPELFPRIREEMVVEFGLAGSNGHAGA